MSTKLGRPPIDNPKSRVHITIEKEVKDIADRHNRSAFFNEAGKRFKSSKGYKTWARQQSA